MNIKNPKEHLIIALDTSSRDEAMKLVLELKDSVSYFKVGLELFTSCGPEIIKQIKEYNLKIFFDGKFLDIPNTVSKALSNIVLHKVDMLNIHLTGGTKMIVEAKKAVIETAKIQNILPPKLLGVTVLTSMNNDDLKENVESYVLKQAKLALNSGLDGVICSANEAKIVRKATNKDFIIVTPGIRPEWASKDDQNRIATPKEAILNGASHIVVGRPITKDANPKKATDKILNEIKEALNLKVEV